MTELVQGKSEADVRRLFEGFHLLATGDDGETPSDLTDEMDRLQVLSGVREFPMRVKCATLAWHTMNAALLGQNKTTTETK
jgi:nitrogen fixation NifU-like protein